MYGKYDNKGLALEKAQGEERNERGVKQTKHWFRLFVVTRWGGNTKHIEWRVPTGRDGAGDRATIRSLCEPRAKTSAPDL